MKLKAPLDCGGFGVGDVDYVVDDNGEIEVDDLSHLDDLLRLGATRVGSDSTTTLIESVPVGSISDIAHEAVVSRVTSLETEVSLANSALSLAFNTSAMAGVNGFTSLADGIDKLSYRLSEVGSTLEGITDASASGQGDDNGGGQSEDLSGSGGSSAVNYDEMTRDEMVDWLREKGVSVSPSISKAAARSAIDDTLNKE